MRQQRLTEPRFLLRLTIFVFFGLLWVPILQMWFHFAPEMESTEKRALAPKPQLTSASIQGLMDYLLNYEKFFNDRFGFRNTLVHYNNVFKMKYLKIQQPIPAIVVGEDGWLFYNSPIYGVSLKDYCGFVPYSSSQLSAIKNTIDEDYAYLKAKGIHYLIVIAPSKHSIYPEYLPKNIIRVSNLTRLDQVAAHLSGHSPASFLDLRAPLLEAKHVFPVYCRTDTHWTTFGAFIGYREIMKSLSALFPCCSPLCTEDFDINRRKIPAAGDMAEMLSIKGAVDDFDVLMVGRIHQFQSRMVEESIDTTESRVVLRRYMSEAPLSAPVRILMFHDSFGWSLQSFLAEHFPKSTFVAGDLQAPNKLIDEEKPDVVILEITERSLDALRNPHFAGKP